MKSKLPSFSRMLSLTWLVSLPGRKATPTLAAALHPEPAMPNKPANLRKAINCHMANGSADKSAKVKAKCEDDSNDEMHGHAAVAAARRRERTRCAAIMGCQAAAKNPALAAGLAFKTRLTRQEAIQFLESLPIEAQVPSPPPSSRLKAPSLVRMSPQQIADQRLKWTIAQANQEHSRR